MAPPAINLAAAADDPSSFPFSSKIHLIHSNNNTSSEEERENTDGAVDELNAAAAAAASTTPTGKRPRGRPPGSKNKAKAPTYLSVDPQDALRSHVMEVASGADISSSLSAYARSRGRGLAVLHAFGSVAGLTFRNGSSHPLFLKGKLDLISLSGTILPDNATLGPAGLTAFVSGPHGQVMGGPVVGRLVSDGTVMVMAATFTTATYEKLPPQVAQEAAAGGFDGPGQDPGMEDPRYPSAGFNMGMGIHGSGQEASYAWFLHHQQQQQQQHQQNNSNNNNNNNNTNNTNNNNNNNNNGRGIYME